MCLFFRIADSFELFQKDLRLFEKDKSGYATTCVLLLCRPLGWGDVLPLLFAHACSLSLLTRHIVELCITVVRRTIKFDL